ncbi:MAG: signal peptide peptidase SppA [Geobacter sp.]|nr:signal peptide peptidase SppA [Geobacter sp.]
MNRSSLLCLVLFSLACPGCAFINVDMLKPLQPLQEKVIEGDGTPKILLIDITGFVSERDQGASQLSQEKPSTVALVKEALQKADTDKEIAGIVMRINSPGGTVTASDIIHHEILAFKARHPIPVYASIVGLGTSGGYYVATAADRISAHPTAVTGSIGVILFRFNLSGLLAKVGVAEESVKSGDKKDILSPFRKTTADEQQIIQEIIDRLYSRFTDVVLSRQGNRLTKESIKPLADGRIFTADQALNAQLIDKICYLEDDIADMKQQLQIPEARIIRYYRPGSFQSSIYSTVNGTAAPTVNLVNINADGIDMFQGTQFLYLWQH